MNKLELELDEKKVLADGEYNLDELYGYIDCIAVTEKGLRKEGNFYIEDDPVDDGFGMIAAVELILLRNDWFRKYVKTLNCYRQYGDRQSDIAILRTGNCASRSAPGDRKIVQTCRFPTLGLSDRMKQQGSKRSRSTHL